MTSRRSRVGAFSIAAPKHSNTRIVPLVFAIPIKLCIIYNTTAILHIILKCEKEKMSEHQNLGEFDAHVAKRYQVSKL